MNLHRLIYSSHAHRSVNARVVTQIVNQARINNRALGITGVLFHIKGRFYQVLEGDKFFLQHLYLKICKDKRHDRLELLAFNAITRRAFSEWFMGSRTTALPGAGRVDSDNVLFVLLNLHELLDAQPPLPPLYHEGTSDSAAVPVRFSPDNGSQPPATTRARSTRARAAARR
jgi:hypothetical protein